MDFNDWKAQCQLEFSINADIGSPGSSTSRSTYSKNKTWETHIKVCSLNHYGSILMSPRYPGLLAIQVPAHTVLKFAESKFRLFLLRTVFELILTDEKELSILCITIQ
jgi:hypothetical protein